MPGGSKSQLSIDYDSLASQLNGREYQQQAEKQYKLCIHIPYKAARKKWRELLFERRCSASSQRERAAWQNLFADLNLDKV